MVAIGAICIIPSCRHHLHHLLLCSPVFCCTQMSEHIELLVFTILPPHSSIVFFTFFLPHPVVLLLTILSYKTYQQHCFFSLGFYALYIKHTFLNISQTVEVTWHWFRLQTGWFQNSQALLTQHSSSQRTRRSSMSHQMAGQAAPNQGFI